MGAAPGGAKPSRRMPAPAFEGVCVSTQTQAALSAGFWRVETDGVTLRVKVQPRARRAGLRGAAPAADGGTRLGVAVTEAPEDGRANRAVCAAIAAALGVAPSAVEVAQGAGSREKLLRVVGDPRALVARLGTLGA